jgi:hypothetical protein
MSSTAALIMNAGRQCEAGRRVAAGANQSLAATLVNTQCKEAEKVATTTDIKPAQDRPSGLALRPCNQRAAAKRHCQQAAASLIQRASRYRGVQSSDVLLSINGTTVKTSSRCARPVGQDPTSRWRTARDGKVTPVNLG